jgi:hypothetical protein
MICVCLQATNCFPASPVFWLCTCGESFEKITSSKLTLYASDCHPWTKQPSWVLLMRPCKVCLRTTSSLHRHFVDNYIFLVSCVPVLGFSGRHDLQVMEPVLWSVSGCRPRAASQLLDFVALLVICGHSFPAA